MPAAVNESTCTSCNLFRSEIQALAEVATEFTAVGRARLAAETFSRLNAIVREYGIHIDHDHGSPIRRMKTRRPPAGRRRQANSRVA